MKMNINEMTNREITRYVVDTIGLKPKSKILPTTSQMLFHCPFHKDNTPSLGIDFDKQLWGCFSCNRGGRISSLYREFTGSSLYKDLGLNTPTKGTMTSYVYEKKREQETTSVEDETKLKSVNINYDPTDIQSIESVDEVVQYLKSRGISLDVAHSMHMGYMPNGYVNNKRFFRRLIIPVYENGRLISLEGRRVFSEDPDPKVLYPANATVNTLYDYDNLDRHSPLYAVEGLMDLAVLRSCPTFANSTSIFGAALTKRQRGLLKEFDKVIYINDLDEAGDRTVQTLKEMECDNFYSLRLPSNIRGVAIKDVGDLPKAGVMPQDLVDRRWLTHIAKL